MMNILRNNDLKYSNKLNVLRILYKTNYSRVDLSKRLGLSKSAITGLVDELIEDGFIEEVGRGTSGESGGKKPIILSVNKFAGLIIAVHFNSVCCEIAITDMLGDVLGIEKLELILDADYSKTFDHIIKEINLLKAEMCELTNKYPILACGISAKGLVDTKEGVIKYSSAVAEWNDVPVANYFSDKLGVSTFVENDARSITCLETLKSKNSDIDIIACVSIESGIGTSVIINNNIITGSYFGAVNFAHTIVDHNGPLCRCGKRGCWETHASTDALLKKIKMVNNSYKDMCIEDILSEYKRGNSEVTHVIIDDLCYWIGIGVSNFLTAFNPKKLIIYGNQDLLDHKAQQKVLEVIKKHTNKVTSKTLILFETDIDTLHLRSAASVVIKSFLSNEHHYKFSESKELKQQ